MINYLNKFIKSFRSDSKHKQMRLDSWINTLTGINYNSRAGSSRWCANKSYDLNQAKLDSIYSKDGICKRIIDIYPEEALRAFIDCDIRILEELDRLKLKSKTFEACRDARLFGGSVVVAFVDDGRDLQDELDYTNIDKLIHLKVFDRFKVTWFPTDLVTDHLDEDFGMPEFYTIQNNSFVNSDSIQFRVHKSRIFRFSGDATTEFSKKNNQGWDNSCLVNLYESIRAFGEAAGISAEIIQGYLETTLKIPGFSDSFRQDSLGADMRKRIDKFNKSKGAFKTIFLDVDEEYQKHTTNAHGLSELWDRFGEIISATSSIPVSVLFGRSAGGLNSTGKQELDLMNNKVEEYRNNHIKPFFAWIFKILEAQKSFVAEEDIDFHWEFHPLITLDEKKEAETRKLNAEIDIMYINAGVLTPKIVLDGRYHADQPFNNNMMLTKEDLNNLEKEMNQAELEEERLNAQDLELIKDLEQEKLDKENKMNADSKESEFKAKASKLDEYLMNSYLEKIEKHK